MAPSQGKKPDWGNVGPNLTIGRIEAIEAHGKNRSANAYGDPSAVEGARSASLFGALDWMRVLRPNAL